MFFCRYFRSTGIRYSSLFFLLLWFLPCFFSELAAPSSAQASHITLQKICWQKKLDLYQKNESPTREQSEHSAAFIKNLQQNNLRVILRACLLAPEEIEQCKEMWAFAAQHQISEQQADLFRGWSMLDKASLTEAHYALATIISFSPEAAESFKKLLLITDLDSQTALNLAGKINFLDVAQNKAFAALLSKKELKAKEAVNQLIMLRKLSTEQALVAESFARIKGTTPLMISDALQLLPDLEHNTAVNAAYLFQQSEIPASEAWNFLGSYFALPASIQEQKYLTFDKKEKSLLLNSFYASSEPLIKKINDLHSISDNVGAEIAQKSLVKYSDKKLLELLCRLSVPTQERFEPQLQKALQSGQKKHAISLLRKATAEERVYCAEQLSSANIYALLARGGELYDSSFRDILIPVLKNRISILFNNDILAFLKAIDPENTFSADFITSCAQKGSLPLLFPSDPLLQKHVLDVVAQSAFRSINTVLIFSATMEPLLRTLKPQARSHLISLMVDQAKKTKAEKGRLLAASLQYYKTYRRGLLAQADINQISSLKKQYQPIAFSRFTKTPFKEWVKDSQLASLSFFHPDDDGRKSFTSFARLLRGRNYTIEAAEDYSFMAEQELTQPCRNIMLRAHNESSYLSLFSCMRSGAAVAFTKNINGIQIRHVLTRYTSPEHQQALLLKFMNSNAEMLIQRGHSYWRDEQILDPMHELIQNNRLKPDLLTRKQRFLSLGSCGGVKVYTKANDLFAGSVDILATIGTGVTKINNPFNTYLFELIATRLGKLTWADVSKKTRFIFNSELGKDYLRPGSLTDILHKMINEQRELTTLSGSDL